MPHKKKATVFNKLDYSNTKNMNSQKLSEIMQQASDPKFQALTLENTLLDDVLVDELTKSLRKNQNLRELNLKNCGISIHGLKKIQDLLTPKTRDDHNYNSTLITIDLKANLPNFRNLLLQMQQQQLSFEADLKSFKKTDEEFINKIKNMDSKQLIKEKINLFDQAKMLIAQSMEISTDKSKLKPAKRKMMDEVLEDLKSRTQDKNRQAIIVDIILRNTLFLENNKEKIDENKKIEEEYNKIISKVKKQLAKNEANFKARQEGTQAKIKRGLGKARILGAFKAMPAIKERREASKKQQQDLAKRIENAERERKRMLNLQELDRIGAINLQREKQEKAAKLKEEMDAVMREEFLGEEAARARRKSKPETTIQPQLSPPISNDKKSYTQLSDDLKSKEPKLNSKKATEISKLEDLKKKLEKYTKEKTHYIKKKGSPLSMFDIEMDKQVEIASAAIEQIKGTINDLEKGLVIDIVSLDQTTAFLKDYVKRNNDLRNVSKNPWHHLTKGSLGSILSEGIKELEKLHTDKPKFIKPRQDPNPKSRTKK